MQDEVEKPAVSSGVAKTLDILQPGWLTGDKEIPSVNNVVKSQQ